MSGRPSQAQLREARDVLTAIIEEMPDPSKTWRAEAAAAYLQGAVAALNAATATNTTTTTRKAEK
jgi:hypothetical protein